MMQELWDLCWICFFGMLCKPGVARGMLRRNLHSEDMRRKAWIWLIWDIGQNFCPLLSPSCVGLVFSGPHSAKIQRDEIRQGLRGRSSHGFSSAQKPTLVVWCNNHIIINIRLFSPLTYSFACMPLTSKGWLRAAWAWGFGLPAWWQGNKSQWWWWRK